MTSKERYRRTPDAYETKNDAHPRAVLATFLDAKRPGGPAHLAFAHAAKLQMLTAIVNHGRSWLDHMLSEDPTLPDQSPGGQRWLISKKYRKRIRAYSNEKSYTSSKVRDLKDLQNAIKRNNTGPHGAAYSAAFSNAKNLLTLYHNHYIGPEHLFSGDMKDLNKRTTAYMLEHDVEVLMSKAK